MAKLYDFTADSLAGKPQQLSQYAGQVTLVVNTASKCGLAPQFDGLEDLYSRYHEQGFTILGFPCNQFGLQEPGDADKTTEVCRLTYGTTFPMFSKINVNGSSAHPLYKWLKSEQGGVLGSAIKWNFTKFLIGRDGNVLGRFAPTKSPESLTMAIEQALSQESSTGAFNVQ